MWRLTSPSTRPRPTISTHAAPAARHNRRVPELITPRAPAALPGTEGTVRLADLTTLRVGGPARRVLTADDDAALAEAVREADATGEPLLVLGGGSNLLVSDAGFDGTVLAVRTRGLREVAADADGVRLRVAAGEEWDAVVAATVAQGWSGIEALAGIPGAAGATPIQNVGAYGQEVAQTVVAVEALDRTTGEQVSLSPEECGFAYRHSIFKHQQRWVVTAVHLRLGVGGTGTPVRYGELARALGVEPGGRAPVGEVREAVLALRRGKGMVLDAEDHDTWSAGSFFTNPVLSEAVAAAVLPDDAPRYPAGPGLVKTSAAWLIEHAGFAKGHGAGAATLSTKHTLALTNRGDATAADVVALAREVRDGVQARFGVRLEPEPVLVGLTL